MARLKADGVFFANSHAVYPTFTTPNASALATGHQLGDTGDFANALSPGSPSTGPRRRSSRTIARWPRWTRASNGNFLGEETLLAAARAQGFSTAALGKVGPTLIQDVTQGNGGALPSTIVIDDSTGSVDGVALDPAIAAKLKAPRPPAKSVPNVGPAEVPDRRAGRRDPAGVQAARAARSPSSSGRATPTSASTARRTARPTGTSASMARRRSARSGTPTTRWGGSWPRSRPTLR